MWNIDQKSKVCKLVRDENVWKQVKNVAHRSYNKGISKNLILRHLLSLPSNQPL